MDKLRKKHIGDEDSIGTELSTEKSDKEEIERTKLKKKSLSEKVFSGAEMVGNMLTGTSERHKEHR
jgi:hypothetical protein